MAGRQPYLRKRVTTTEKKNNMNIIHYHTITFPASDLAGKVLEERMKRKLFFHFLQLARVMEKEYELELR